MTKEEAENREWVESKEAIGELAEAEARLAAGEVYSAEDILLVKSPQAKRGLAEAEARLAAGNVRKAEEVRREQAGRFPKR